MEDIEIWRLIKSVMTLDMTPNQQKLVKGIRTFYKKAGGLSMHQVQLLKDIQKQILNEITI